jgi:hypothetical protein
MTNEDALREDPTSLAEAELDRWVELWAENYSAGLPPEGVSPPWHC